MEPWMPIILLPFSFLLYQMKDDPPKIHTHTHIYIYKTVQLFFSIEYYIKYMVVFSNPTITIYQYLFTMIPYMHLFI